MVKCENCPVTGYCESNCCDVQAWIDKHDAEVRANVVDEMIAIMNREMNTSLYCVEDLCEFEPKQCDKCLHIMLLQHLNRLKGDTNESKGN